MSTNPKRERIAALLLAELKTGALGWYYISVADEKDFHGGFLIQARGPTDAWCLLHALCWWTEGCSTQTTGPIPQEAMEKIPENLRWRKLTKEEALSLGRG